MLDCFGFQGLPWSLHLQKMCNEVTCKCICSALVSFMLSLSESLPMAFQRREADSRHQE